MWRWKRSRDSLCSRSLSSRIARVPEPFSRWMRVSDRRSSTETTGTKISPEEIKRVKGLGCLKDKRYDDIFNIRVLTRNGRITTEEHRAIADAAEKFGNGEITMTTRLSMEIQGVPYGNLEGAIAFLAEHGLTTGGTGSLVRPVVSCKGTTCQYGLIDTFSLSEI